MKHATATVILLYDYNVFDKIQHISFTINWLALVLLQAN